MNGLSDKARAVVEAGRADGEPTAADRARIRGALMAKITAGAAAPATATARATATATKTTGGFLGATGTKVAAIVGLACAVAAGALLRSPGEAPRGAATAAALATTDELPPAEEAAPVEQTLTAPAPIDVAAASARAAAPAREEAPSRPAPPEPRRAVGEHDRRAAGTEKEPAKAAPDADPAGDRDTLEAEVRGLREAHRAMQSGDAARALSVLDEQATSYAGGALDEERAAARVLALCEVGRSTESRAAAARFLQEHPRSPLSDRVRAACPEKASP